MKTDTQSSKDLSGDGMPVAASWLTMPLDHQYMQHARLRLDVRTGTKSRRC